VSRARSAIHERDCGSVIIVNCKLSACWGAEHARKCGIKAEGVENAGKKNARKRLQRKSLLLHIDTCHGISHIGFATHPVARMSRTQLLQSFLLMCDMCYSLCCVGVITVITRKLSSIEVPGPTD